MILLGKNYSRITVSREKSSSVAEKKPQVYQFSSTLFGGEATERTATNRGLVVWGTWWLVSPRSSVPPPLAKDLWPWASPSITLLCYALVSMSVPRGWVVRAWAPCSSGKRRPRQACGSGDSPAGWSSFRLHLDFDLLIISLPVKPKHLFWDLKIKCLLKSNWFPSTFSLCPP